jgi:hypothetical protein
VAEFAHLVERAPSQGSSLLVHKTAPPPLMYSASSKLCLEGAPGSSNVACARCGP